MECLNRYPPSDKLSDVLDDPEVTADMHRRVHHSGWDCARQFNLDLTYVIDMLHHMWERYDTVSVYSLGMLEPGTIIYYLEPYTLGLLQADQGWGTAAVGGPGCTARVHLKGRFGIVLNVFSQHLKVAEMATFGGKGLAQAKAQRCWHEYVGIRSVDQKNYLNPSPNRALEVGFSCCRIDPKASVHLLTDKISLGSQVLIAGNITSDSLARLQTMVKKLENRSAL